MTAVISIIDDISINKAISSLKTDNYNSARSRAYILLCAALQIIAWRDRYL